jgi:hypothetical protein
MENPKPETDASDWLPVFSDLKAGEALDSRAPGETAVIEK